MPQATTTHREQGQVPLTTIPPLIVRFAGLQPPSELRSSPCSQQTPCMKHVAVISRLSTCQQLPCQDAQQTDAGETRHQLTLSKCTGQTACSLGYNRCLCKADACACKSVYYHRSDSPDALTGGLPTARAAGALSVKATPACCCCCCCCAGAADCMAIAEHFGR